MAAAKEGQEREDWCAEGRRRVEEGSDGLWIRCGPPETDETWASHCCSIRFNPVVSCCSIMMLAALVVFVMAQGPTKSCWRKGTYAVAKMNLQMSGCDGSPLNEPFECENAAQAFGGTFAGSFSSQAMPKGCQTDGAGSYSLNTFANATIAGPSAARSPVCGRAKKMLSNVSGVETWESGITALETYKCHVSNIEFSYWRAWVGKHWTWAYIATQDVWIMFACFLYFTKYSNLKLGKDDDVPEFSNFAWFSMIFSCGVGTGLFYFGVAEPIWHYEPCYGGPYATEYGAVDSRNGVDGATYGYCSGNRYGMLNDNKRAQEAMNLTFYHWGLHGWIAYALVGILLALLHFRKGLPMTIKTCFYPLIGTRIYGFWGDFIDAVSVVATTMGVCTSLGLGVMQLQAGIMRLNGGKNWVGNEYFGEANYKDWSADIDYYKDIWLNTPETYQVSNPWTTAAGGLNYASAAKVAQNDHLVTQQILLVWLITLMATGSVVCGLKYGVKNMALTCFGLGCFLMWVIMVMDDTWYLLNLYTQSLGYYVQYFWELGWYSGAFAQSEHSAPDGKGESAGWLNSWTIFYWGWWIAWAPFVGVFFARISKGRTIKEFFNGCIFLPVFYNFAWMVVFGGAGLKMEMLAAKYGVTCANGPAKNICRAVSTDRYSGEKEFFCSTVTRLSCRGSTDMVFDLFMQYEDMGVFFCVICLVSLILYFVSSSDSGSLVDDMVTANGIEEPPIAQRIFWAWTEGMSASALLSGAKYLPDSPNAGLRALQSASISVGLPYTALVCYMCLALWRTIQYEFGERVWKEGFQNSVLDIGVLAYSSGPSLKPRRFHNFAKGKMDFRRLGTFILYIFVPGIGMFPAFTKLHQIESKAKGRSPHVKSHWPLLYTAFSSGLLFLAVYLCCIDAIPVSEGVHITTGSMMGPTDGRTYTSRRYGTFREWTFEKKEGQDVSVTPKPTWYPEAQESMSVGERVGWPQHYMCVGSFMFLIFVSMVAFLRNNIRVACKIPGNVIEDFLCSTFLWPSVIMQCKEHVFDYQIKEAEKCQ